MRFASLPVASSACFAINRSSGLLGETACSAAPAVVRAVALLPTKATRHEALTGKDFYLYGQPIKYSCTSCRIAVKMSPSIMPPSYQPARDFSSRSSSFYTAIHPPSLLLGDSFKYTQQIDTVQAERLLSRYD